MVKPVPAGPGAYLVVVQPDLALDGLEPFFNGPTGPRDADQGGQRDRGE
jgi:hypothetical protein